ncbi:MAG TPA: hypothetical protein VMT18_07830 [Planctomycetota bacterium]|nr:hypothetical protein [Planctomycetota bacterium]
MNPPVRTPGSEGRVLHGPDRMPDPASSSSVLTDPLVTALIAPGC